MSDIGMFTNCYSLASVPLFNTAAVPDPAEGEPWPVVEGQWYVGPELQDFNAPSSP